jgi:hypothetical protein
MLDPAEGGMGEGGSVRMFQRCPGSAASDLRAFQSLGEQIRGRMLRRACPPCSVKYLLCPSLPLRMEGLSI